MARPEPQLGPEAHGAVPIRQRLIELAQRASLEVSARDPLAGEGLRELVAPGTRIFINFAPGDTHHGIVAAAARLGAAGYRPVPHVAARTLASFTQFNDHVVRMVGEAGVEEALVVAGDLDRPIGPYHGSVQLLESGVFERHGLRRLAVAAYPEGHLRIATRALDEALGRKLALARERGIDLAIVTQFGFEAEPILRWLRRLRAQGIDRPIRIGLAGPASIATLAKFAVRCGIGASLRALVGGQGGAVARLLSESGPEPVMWRLAAETAEADIALHLFSFGGVRRTSLWLAAIARGAFELSGQGEGFRVWV